LIIFSSSGYDRRGRVKIRTRSRAGRVGVVVEPELFGPYRLDELIGRGGMGEVYRAFDTRLDRVVALKRLPVALGADVEFVARFHREVAVAARSQAPHIVPIHDYGDIDGRLFLDMRLVTGTDLGRLLADHGPLDPSRAVGIIAQVASALDDAHAQGLVHRDVKPSNVLLTNGDFAYLTDFGVVRALTGNTTLAVAGTTVGTPAYMAPECFLGQHGDHPADVYALACVLFESLTGQPPFGGEELVALMYAHVHLAPPPASRQRPGVPAGLDEVIACGMAKDSSKRYATAGQLASAAATAAVRIPTTDTGLNTIVPPRPPPAADTVQRFHPPPATPDGQALTTDRRQRRHRLLLAIALIIAIATTLVLLRRPSTVDPGTGARLALTASQVKIGATYLVTASGFSPGEDLRFFWTGPTNGVMGVFPADSGGRRLHGPIFERDPPGNYTITVTGLASGRTASASLQVVPGAGAAQLVLSASQVKVDGIYFATASGFSPGEDVRFFWTGPTNGVMGVLPVDSGGSRSHRVVERDPPGTYTITVTGLTSGRTASAELQVVQSGS
jgi:serine/threonine protein kinase